MIDLGGRFSEIKSESGIYCFKNKTNGKEYIGQSINILRRIKQHCHDSFNIGRKDYNYPIHRAIRKYGLENFEVFVLEYCDSSTLDEREKYFIKERESCFNGYNILSGGDFSPMRIPEIQEQVNEKRVITMMEKYGVTNPLQVKEIRDKWYSTMKELYWDNPESNLKERIKQTIQEKYGVDYIGQSKTVRVKIKNTCLDKYGSSTYLQSEIGKQTIKENNLKKYGVEHNMQRPEVKEKMLESNLKNGRFKCYKNTDTGFIFASKEASVWLDREDFSKHISRSLKQKNKRFGNIPEDMNINRSLWGAPAHWELATYEEYLNRINQ